MPERRIRLFFATILFSNSFVCALSFSRSCELPRAELYTQPIQNTRRSFFFQTAATAFIVPWQPSYATDLFVRNSDKVHYIFQPPPGFDTPSQKPLKTHLDEVTFRSNTDVQFGITVDPLRISKLSDFGTPEQVAAKVVTAEVNRDGVFEVKLMEDPLSASDASYYQLNYRSSGKRGVKRYVAKFYVENQMLYALTAQCKEENYESAKADIFAAVESFRVTSRAGGLE